MIVLDRVFDQAEVTALARLRKVDALLKRELEVTTMQAEIQYQAKEEMSRGQREAFLREQLRAIQTELGEVDPRGEETDERKIRHGLLPYRKKIVLAGDLARAGQ